MNVLLISPRLRPDDPRRCGDHTYTDMLLQYPPEGVRYQHYGDLVAHRQVQQIRSLQLLTHNLRKYGFLPPDTWVEMLHSEWIPDLVHIYGFSAKIRLPGASGLPPVILGTSTGSTSDLRYYHGWSEAKIRHFRWRKRWFLRLLGAFDSSLSPEKAAHVLTWSDFARHLHLEEGYVRPEQISTLYPGLPVQPVAKSRQARNQCVTFLFVGSDFERKNGNQVLEAFRSVHASYANTRLLLVGRPDDGRIIVEGGVHHRHFVPRQELFQDIFPQADVLLLPSRAEGFGLVILEAMSLGLPAIVVDAWAMPEIICDGDNGFLIRPDSAEDLVERMKRMAARPELVSAMRQHCFEIFEQRFSIEAHNRQLQAIYSNALSCNLRRNARPLAGKAV